MAGGDAGRGLVGLAPVQAATPAGRGPTPAAWRPSALPWATTDQLTLVRKGFCEDQIVWLLAQYRTYLKGEYPELAGVGATAEDKARVKAQATDLFTDAPR